MRLWLALTFVMLASSVAFADPAVTEDPDELRLQIMPPSLEPLSLELEIPHLVLASPRVGHSILDNALMRALFRGVEMPALSTPRALLRIGDPRLVNVALRPASAGGVLRLRVRFDAALFDNAGPLRRLLDLRRVDL